MLRKTVAIILQIIIEGVIGSSYHSDIAVDDIYLSKGTCCQLQHRAFDSSVGELKFFAPSEKKKVVPLLFDAEALDPSTYRCLTAHSEFQK